MNPGLDSVDQLVRQFWPRYKASIQPMWDTRLHQYPSDKLSETLRKYRADHPDDTKPVWRAIYAMLAGGTAGPGKSDLQLLLDSIRRAIATEDRWQKCPQARGWSDSEVFENHIEANVKPILRRMDGTAEDDPGGRLARLAASTRANMVSYYIRDLKERGDPVPEWLVR